MRNVLVIDDCPEVCEIINEILADDGFKVTTLNFLEDVESTMEGNTFDIILCDIVLPVDDTMESALAGVHTIEDLAKRYPATPVIAISGELTGPPLLEMKRFGAVNAISKPFTRDELLQKVHAALGDLSVN